MKIIDLLNKIANGEEVPKKFKLGYTIYEQTYKGGEYRDKNKAPFNYWIWNLNEEIEIIEEDKKIEKIDCVNKEDGYSTIDFDMVQDKINELIDEVNKLKGDKNKK